MSSQTAIQEIACQQIVAEDASVFSVQWTDLPLTTGEAISAQELLLRYLDYICTFTLTLIRPITSVNGIEFRFFKTKLNLLSFFPPVYTGCFVTLRICGGFLVQQNQQNLGEFSFGAEPYPDSIRVSLQLSDYRPLILGGNSPTLARVWFFHKTQAVIHRMVTVRFLALLYKEITGAFARVKVVSVTVRAGRPV